MTTPKGLHKRVDDLAMTVLAELGGAATVDEVTRHLLLALGGDDRQAMAFEGVSKLVGARFRRVGGSGLPDAPAVDEHDTHMQLELLSEAEFKYVIRSCLAGARRYRRRAEQYRDQCALIHGVVYDLAEIEAEVATELSA